MRRGTGQEEVRRHNLSVLLRHLHAAGPTTRSDLTARTGLNRSTIGVLVGDLAARGFVVEGKATATGGPGRPSPPVHPRPEGAVALALEVDVDSLAAATVGLGGHVLGRRRVDRPGGRFSPEDTVDELARLARPLLRRLPAGAPVVAAGVAVVGLVRVGDGCVRVAPNLGWVDVPLAALVRRRLRLRVPVAVGNEADLGARSEHVRGAGVGIDDLVYLSGEVGVGAGIIVGGRHLRGAEGYGGEVGHLPVNPAGQACGCGSVGCWETEVGEGALLRRAGRSAEPGDRTAVRTLLDDARAGDDAARAAVEAFGRWLGVGLAGVVNVFNPRRVVLGGLFAELHPLVARTVDAELDGRALDASRAVVDVVVSALGVDAPLLGAAELALDELLGDPTRMPPLAEQTKDAARA